MTSQPPLAQTTPDVRLELVRMVTASGWARGVTPRARLEPDYARPPTRSMSDPASEASYTPDRTTQSRVPRA